MRNFRRVSWVKDSCWIILLQRILFKIWVALPVNQAWLQALSEPEFISWSMKLKMQRSCIWTSHTEQFLQGNMIELSQAAIIPKHVNIYAGSVTSWPFAAANNPRSMIEFRAKRDQHERHESTKLSNTASVLPYTSAPYKPPLTNLMSSKPHKYKYMRANRRYQFASHYINKTRAECQHQIIYP